MSTRCQIEIMDGKFEDHKGMGVLLYHHSDGYPSFQLEKLQRFLDRVKTFLDEAEYPYWWDSERVAAVMVLLSAQSYDNPILLSQKKLEAALTGGVPSYARDPDLKFPDGGVPVYQPCRMWHGDICYIYVVELTGDAYPKAEDTRKYRIRVFKTNRAFDAEGGEAPYGKEITDTWDKDDED